MILWCNVKKKILIINVYKLYECDNVLENVNLDKIFGFYI